MAHILNGEFLQIFRAFGGILKAVVGERSQTSASTSHTPTLNGFTDNGNLTLPSGVSIPISVKSLDFFYDGKVTGKTQFSVWTQYPGKIETQVFHSIKYVIEKTDLMKSIMAHYSCEKGYYILCILKTI